MGRVWLGTHSQPGKDAAGPRGALLLAWGNCDCGSHTLPGLLTPECPAGCLAALGLLSSTLGAEGLGAGCVLLGPGLGALPDTEREAVG